MAHRKIARKKLISDTLRLADPEQLPQLNRMENLSVANDSSPNLVSSPQQPLSPLRPAEPEGPANPSSSSPSGSKNQSGHSEQVSSYLADLLGKQSAAAPQQDVPQASAAAERDEFVAAKVENKLEGTTRRDVASGHPVVPPRGDSVNDACVSPILAGILQSVNWKAQLNQCKKAICSAAVACAAGATSWATLLVGGSVNLVIGAAVVCAAATAIAAIVALMIFCELALALWQGALALSRYGTKVVKETLNEAKEVCAEKFEEMKEGGRKAVETCKENITKRSVLVTVTTAVASGIIFGAASSAGLIGGAPGLGALIGLMFCCGVAGAALEPYVAKHRGLLICFIAFAAIGTGGYALLLT